MQHEILFSKFQPRPTKELCSHGYPVTLPARLCLHETDHDGTYTIQHTTMLIPYYTVIVKVSVTMIGTYAML